MTKSFLFLPPYTIKALSIRYPHALVDELPIFESIYHNSEILGLQEHGGVRGEARFPPKN